MKLPLVLLAFMLFPVLTRANPVQPLSDDGIYKSPNGHSVCLYGNLAAINLYLSENVKTKEDCNTYAQSFLSELVINYLGSKDIYTTKKIQGIAKPLLPYKPAQLSPQQIQIYLKYADRGSKTQKGGITTEQFYFWMPSGGIERWTYTYKAAPLFIISFKQEMVEPEGTLPELTIALM